MKLFMKKYLLLLLFVFCQFATATAQFVVHNNGYVSIMTSGTPVSPLSIGYGGRENYMIAYTGSRNGIFSQTYGSSNGEDRYGGLFLASPDGSNVCHIGIRGEAHKYTSSYDYGRTYGVYGIAGNATSGYNYGLFGSLKGSKNGAAVYGTVNNDNGTNTGDMYAGYFNGKAKVTGNLTVVGGITGIMLSPGYSDVTGSSAKMEKVRSQSDISFTDKLIGLEVVPYYQKLAEKPTAETDTMEMPLEVDYIERQTKEKLHYALSLEQMEQVFPELVYEQEDGTKSVNYIEMIPLLINEIKVLNQKIEALENGRMAKARAAGMAASKLSEAQLMQNRPNPFSGQTVIPFLLPEGTGKAQIAIFDMTGHQLLQIPVDSSMRSITVDGYNLSSGIYLYSLMVNGIEIDTKRMVLTR